MNKIQNNKLVVFIQDSDVGGSVKEYILWKISLWLPDIFYTIIGRVKKKSQNVPITIN
jgi:hypothetical protein